MRQLPLFNVSVSTEPCPAPFMGREACRLEAKYASRLREDTQLGRWVSYVGNKDVPILRLYRYKEAFAFRFVEGFIARFGLTPADYVFDPFCGMGTTLLASYAHGIASIGIDRLPVAVFIARTLPRFLHIEPSELRDALETLKTRVNHAEPAPVAMDVAIMQVAFPADTLLRLRQWKTVIAHLPQPLQDVFLLLFFAILEPCSFTSKDGQFLRMKRDKAVADPDEMLASKVAQAEQDLLLLRKVGWLSPKAEPQASLPRVVLGDTRCLTNVPFERKPTAVITSPPYANRYDYTRTYSLELCFHFVSCFEELRELRHSLLRSHIEARVGDGEEAPHPAVQEVVNALRSRTRELNNPRIPDMLTAYFVDMYRVIQEWSRVLERGARVALVVDNVRFDGMMLPVDLVLSEMAEQAGFRVEEILVARYKGNSSQQMGRYGRMPVRESVAVWSKE
ncbi:MAG: hypothetical protein HPY54_08825 [Chthonomonadetes bacterium]|nr:hypothetical protein [Chthonomonadetes bacterium]